MAHRGKRSKIGRANQEQAWFTYMKRFDTARSITMNFSYHDMENGEVVFTECTVKTVQDKLVAEYGYLPMYAVDHEFGEVLNRFGDLQP